MDTELLTVSQTAEYLKLSEKTVRRLITNGSLQASKLSDRSWRIRASAINAYIDAKSNGGSEDMTILTVTDKGYGRRSYLHKINQDGTVKTRIIKDKDTGEEKEVVEYNYPVKNRGGIGITNYKVSDERGHVCGIRALGTDDDVILISSDGIIIRIRANDIRPLNRPANGVRVMKLTDGNSVVSFTRTEHDDEEKTEEVEQPTEEDMVDADDTDDQDTDEVIEDEEDVSDDIEE